MENIEIEAKNYAVNRRNENYDAESDIFELENGGILKPAEVEKIIEEVRTEAFVAGAKFIMNLNSDKITNLLQQEIISLNEKIKNLNKKKAELKENYLKLLEKDGYVKFTSKNINKAKEIIEKLLEEEKNNMYWEMNGSDKSLYYEVRKQAEQFLKEEK